LSKISKALIIRRLQVPISMEYAQFCAESCEKHNLDYEFIDAVEFLECREAFKSVGAKKNKFYKNRMGNCCCHASHIKCWKRIIELDKTCIILEHDAVVKGDVCNIEIPDMVTTTFGHRVEHLDDYEPPNPATTLIRIKKALGVHACALTPKTAKWFWEDARNNGVKIGIDQYLMMRPPTVLPLYVCEPPQVVCWERIATSKFTKEDQTPYTNPPVVFSESITEGWKKGYKHQKSG
jgi:hypothetical protein